MTPRRLTPRRVKLEKAPQDVLSLLVAGKTQAEVARTYSVSREAVSKFVDRHASELVTAVATIEQQVTDHAIANKVWRIGELQSIYDESKADTQLAESPSDKAVILKTRMQALRLTAEELGQLPRPDQNINLRAQVLIRQVEGTDPEALS